MGANGDGTAVTAHLVWDEVPEALRVALAAPVQQSRRARPEAVQAAVLALCTGRYLGRHVLAQLLNRNADDLLKRSLTPMVKAGQLKAAYAVSRDPRQAYTASN